MKIKRTHMFTTNSLTETYLFQNRLLSTFQLSAFMNLASFAPVHNNKVTGFYFHTVNYLLDSLIR